MVWFKAIRRSLAPQEVKEALAALDELGCKFFATEMGHRLAFNTVRAQVEPVILAHPRQVAEGIRNHKVQPREYVCSAMANAAGDLLATGRYNIRRGCPGPIGQAMFALYKIMMAELVELGSLDDDYAREQTQMLGFAVAQAG